MRFPGRCRKDAPQRPVGAVPWILLLAGAVGAITMLAGNFVLGSVFAFVIGAFGGSVAGEPVADRSEQRRLIVGGAVLAAASLVALAVWKSVSG